MDRPFPENAEVVIHPTAQVAGGTPLGSGTSVGPGVIIEENVVVVIDGNRNPACRRPLLGALPSLHEGAAITRQVVHALCRAYEQAVDAIRSHAFPDPL